MALPGRKPKPTALKALAGFPGHHPVNENEPKPLEKAPSMPRRVLPKRARKAWRELAPKMEELGLLAEVDWPDFMLLCVWCGIALDAAALIREVEERPTTEQGLLDEDERGRERKNRALTWLRAASKEIRLLSGGFGLNPGSRSRIEVMMMDDEPSIAEVLFARVTSDE